MTINKDICESLIKIKPCEGAGVEAGVCGTADATGVTLAAETSPVFPRGGSDTTVSVGPPSRCLLRQPPIRDEKNRLLTPRTKFLLKTTAVASDRHAAPLTLSVC